MARHEEQEGVVGVAVVSCPGDNIYHTSLMLQGEVEGEREVEEQQAETGGDV